MPCLRMLAHEENIPLAVLSNGNAEIKTGADATNELGRLLAKSITARDIGAMKPNIVNFLSLAQMFNSHPSRILYVGDSFDNDIVGAKGVNMHCALLTRGSTVRNSQGDTVYRPDIHLSSLDPVEFREKVFNYIVNQIELVDNNVHGWDIKERERIL